MSMPNDLNKPAKKECGTRGNGYETYQILHFGFAALPILAGLDKFFNLLTNWSQYLASTFNLLGLALGALALGRLSQKYCTCKM